MKALRSSALLCLFTLPALLVGSACGDEDVAPPDGGGGDASLGLDGGETDGGAGPDARDGDGGEGGCMQVTAADWSLERSDDVSVGYAAVLTPSVELTGLTVLFERYDPSPDIGTFELGTGMDANFGGCAHCVFVRVTADRGYFADRGTMVTRTDPYSQRLDMTLTNVRLVEVMIDGETRSSTPIPDGRCVELAEVTVDDVFPPEAWTCADESYGDGESCHCACGAFDPDCNRMDVCPPFDPECMPTEPLPLVDCGAEEICGFDPLAMAPECVETCDWIARDGCGAGICSFTFGVTEEDTCITHEEQIDDAALGEACAPGGLQKVCNVDGGFALGFCGPANRCRPVCMDDAECTVDGETCRRFLFDGPLGYCGPEPVDG